MVRQKVVLTRDEVHRLLGLPEDVAVVEMAGHPAGEGGTPPTMHIVFEGSALPAGWRLPAGTVRPT